ncbi:hypothetical protein PAESOLCIP111_01655 [Paenibacillus solanacearum]|uniref:Lipoprotein n=1 Tax=Paenibacillus solanacearum TaxID=2048548 RepID=A0A916JZZ2_9BACL|nr:hypothetical protein [Paenibacillus solanacearum]CAG7613886.1 hypothetical protein PAESOLCIP111_01655 [Paenibacillus solanacearum]
MRRNVLIALLLLFVLAGCGGGPKADVPIFLMSATGVPNEVADKLGQSLQAKLGTAPTVKVLTTPIFSVEKLMVEIAAAENGIIIIPTQQFKALGQQGGYVPLDDLAKAEDFPDGVLEITEDGKTQKHLYGIPMEKTKWFTELNFNGKDLYAFIPANAPNMEKSKQVMKQIAQK